MKHFLPPHGCEADLSFASLPGKDRVISGDQLIVDNILQKESILIVDRIRVDGTKPAADCILFFSVGKRCFSGDVVSVYALD